MTGPQTERSHPQDRDRTILVVDDEMMVRIALCDYLEECGFRVLEASDTRGAIAILERPGLKIDLVFSDVRMPGDLDGVGLAQWVRTHRPGLPVFLASGDVGKVNTARELCAAEAFFTKPYELHKVGARISQLFAA